MDFIGIRLFFSVQTLMCCHSSNQTTPSSGLTVSATKENCGKYLSALLSRTRSYHGIYTYITAPNPCQSWLLCIVDARCLELMRGVTQPIYTCGSTCVMLYSGVPTSKSSVKVRDVPRRRACCEQFDDAMISPSLSRRLLSAYLLLHAHSWPFKVTTNI